VELADNKPTVYVLLTFDFEEWEGRYRVYEADLYKKTKRVVDLLDEKKIPATFFLDAYTVMRYPEASELLNKEEFELALHSDYHYGAVRDTNFRKYPRLVEIPDFRQDSETQVSRIREAVKMIRQIIPKFNPRGFRAPGMLWNEALYASLRKLNFLYDSSQRMDIFYPFLKNGIVVIPMNCGDYDSACYKVRPQYVVEVWKDNFNRACRAAAEVGDSHFLLVIHPSVSGKYKYIGMLKAILNYISWSEIFVEYLTCSELATKYI
jgi:peptidoglycan/xylan/chitin deacetylase (PgdA/CDA1 family)